MSRALLVGTAIALLAAACGDDTGGAGGSGTGGASSASGAGSTSTDAGGSTPSSSAEGTATGTTASGGDGWTCYVVSGGCKCDQSSLPEEIDVCERLCCVAYTDDDGGPACMCSDFADSCEVFLSGPGATSVASCPP